MSKPRAEEPRLTQNEINRVRAAELRMVAGLLDADGQRERADIARENALIIDPPQGAA